jgi:hypothetical protein
VHGGLDLLERQDSENEENQWYTVEDVFPEGITASEVLRGARFREGLTQKQLAAKVGVKVGQIADYLNLSRQPPAPVEGKSSQTRTEEKHGPR